jgi:hypothetical protein
MFKKKGLLGYKSVSFAPAITANVLTYFNGKRIKISFKGKNKFAVKQVVIFADRNRSS